MTRSSSYRRNCSTCDWVRTRSSVMRADRERGRHLRRDEGRQLVADLRAGQARGERLVRAEEQVRQEHRVGRNLIRPLRRRAALRELARRGGAADGRAHRDQLIADASLDDELERPPVGGVPGLGPAGEDAERRPEALRPGDGDALGRPLHRDLLDADRGALVEDREFDLPGRRLGLRVTGGRRRCDEGQSDGTMGNAHDLMRIASRRERWESARPGG